MHLIPWLTELTYRRVALELRIFIHFWRNKVTLVNNVYWRHSVARDPTVLNSVWV